MGRSVSCQPRNRLGLGDVALVWEPAFDLVRERPRFRTLLQHAGVPHDER